MLRRLNALVKCSLRAADGEIGRVSDAYFDDEKWVVRYLVVDTGMWLGWHVLIPPQAITGVDWEHGLIAVALTRNQVEQSPRADLQHPLSRLYETEFYTHFGYPPYWDAPPTWGMAPVAPVGEPGVAGVAMRAQAAAIEHAEGVGPATGSEADLPATPAVEELSASPDPPVESAADSRVRSWREVKGYHIHASDGRIGHVDDLLFDDTSWLVRFIEVDTSNWIGGKSVLVPRSALGVVSWPDSLLHVTLTRDQVKHSPRTDEAHLTGALEQEIDDYYANKRS
jgi:uncharacterized protein YrrD